MKTIKYASELYVEAGKAKTYLVIGLYSKEKGSGFVDTVKAADAEQAKANVLKLRPKATIVAVLVGKVHIAIIGSLSHDENSVGFKTVRG